MSTEKAKPAAVPIAAHLLQYVLVKMRLGCRRGWIKYLLLGPRTASQALTLPWLASTHLPFHLSVYASTHHSSSLSLSMLMYQWQNIDSRLIPLIDSGVEGRLVPVANSSESITPSCNTVFSLHLPDV